MTQFFNSILNIARKMGSTPVPGSKMKSLRKVAEKVRENELYSIIYDECTDVSYKEQISLSVRFLADEQMHEALLDF